MKPHPVTGYRENPLDHGRVPPAVECQDVVAPVVPVLLMPGKFTRVSAFLVPVVQVAQLGLLGRQHDIQAMSIGITEEDVHNSPEVKSLQGEKEEFEFICLR